MPQYHSNRADLNKDSIGARIDLTKDVAPSGIIEGTTLSITRTKTTYVTYGWPFTTGNEIIVRTRDEKITLRAGLEAIYPVSIILNLSLVSTGLILLYAVMIIKRRVK